VRVTLDGGGHATGLLTTELYGLRRTSTSSAVKVTYGWSENGESKTHAFRVGPGQSEHREQILTGAQIRDDFVTIETM
jgi:hypothetical protein